MLAEKEKAGAINCILKGGSMAIYTRFGSEVEVVGYNHNTGDIEVKYQNGDIEDYAIYELKADGGIEEIQEATRG